MKGTTLLKLNWEVKKPLKSIISKSVFAQLGRVIPFFHYADEMELTTVKCTASAVSSIPKSIN